jgi:hypothetical protein
MAFAGRFQAHVLKVRSNTKKVRCEVASGVSLIFCYCLRSHHLNDMKPAPWHPLVGALWGVEVLQKKRIRG